MTHTDLIDELFEQCWRDELQAACGNLDHANYEAFKAGWKAHKTQRAINDEFCPPIELTCSKCGYKTDITIIVKGQAI